MPAFLVHAYLMYGFPTETEQETIDSLERVRQLFAEGCIQSGFWHRFAATAHSPIGQRPERYSPAARATCDLRAQQKSLCRSHRLRSRPPGPGAAQGALQLHARHRAGIRTWGLVRRAARLEPSPPGQGKRRKLCYTGALPGPADLIRQSAARERLVRRPRYATRR